MIRTQRHVAKPDATNSIEYRGVAWGWQTAKWRKWLATHSKLEKHGQLLIAGGLSVLGLAIHARWLTATSLSAGDWRWVSSARLVGWFPWPSAWDPTLGFGQKAFSSIYLDPVFAAAGALARMGVPWEVSEKILFFWPFAVLAMLGPWLLAQRVIGRTPWALLAPFIFAGNTYILIISRMHLTVAMAEALGCFVLLAGINAIKKSSLRWALATGLLLVIQSAYEIRITYLTLLAGVIYLGIVLLAEPSWHVVRLRIGLAGVLLAVFVAGEAYWWVPFISYSGNHDLPISTTPWLDFMYLSHGLTGVHPFWTGSQPVDFRTMPLNPIYFIIPVLAFLPLLKKRVEAEVLWLAVVCLIAAFLIKQNTPPLGQIYDWMFAHFPGWSLFREASKLFFFVALGYAVLVPAATRMLLSAPFGEATGVGVRVATIIACGLTLLISIAGFIPLYLGELGFATVASPVPASFRTVSGILDGDHSYGVVAWIGSPVVWNRNEDRYYALASANHPLLTLSEDANGSDPFLQFCEAPNVPYCYLTNGLLPYLLREVGASYVVAPISPNVGTLPAGITRDWIRQNLTDALGPMVRIGGGLDDLGVWRLANSGVPVVGTEMVALVEGSQQSTVPALPALSALGIPTLYRSSLTPSQSLDSSQVVRVIPGFGGHYQIPTQHSYALLIHSQAQRLTIVQNRAPKTLQRLASLNAADWAAYGPLDLSPGVVLIDSKAPGGLGPIIDWTPASVLVLAQAATQGAGLSIALAPEQVTVKRPDGTPLQGWIELKRAFDQGWRSSLASEQFIGSGLFNLYRLKGAPPSPSEVTFSFGTAIAETIGALVSLLAIFVALAGLAIFRPRKLAPTRQSARDRPRWRLEVAQQLALAGIVLICVGALVAAIEWFAPSQPPQFLIKRTPGAPGEFVLFGALVLLLGAAILRALPPLRPAQPGGLFEPGIPRVPGATENQGGAQLFKPFAGSSGVPVQKRLRARLQVVEPADRLLDEGCSFGRIPQMALARGVREYVGLDPSIAAPQSLGRDISFIAGSALKLPLDDKSFDAVCLFDLIEHLPRGTEIRALDEAHRVLRPAGKLYLSTPHASWIHTPLDPAWYLGRRHYSRARVRSLLELAGFRVERQFVGGGIVEWFDDIRRLIHEHVLYRPLQSVGVIPQVRDDRRGTDHKFGMTMFVVALAHES